MQCDFLNALAFDCAAANCHHPLLLSIYARVKAAVSQHSKPLRIVRVHHPGHQRDESWCANVQRSRRCDHPSSQRIVLMHPLRFTMLNVCADALASLAQQVTATAPLSELQALGSGGDVAR